MDDDIGNKPKSQKYCIPIGNFLPEGISLLANVSDIFMESALRLYIVQGACEKLHPFSASCTDDKNSAKSQDGVQDLASFYLMWNRLLLEIPVLFLLPLCGSWSDNIGRKLPVVLSAVGCSMTAFIYLVSTINTTRYLWLILVGTCIRGIVCRTAVITMVVSSMIADTTTRAERTTRLSFLLATRYIGTLIGLAFQGVLLMNNRFEYVFLLDVFLFGSIMVVALIFIKDSNENAVISQNSEKKKKKLYFWESYKILIKKPDRGTLAQLWILMVILMLDHAGKAGEKEISILFTNIRIPSFTNTDFSWFWTIETILLCLVSTFGVNLVTNVLKMKDTTIAFFAVSMRLVRLIMFAFTYNVPMLYTANLIGTPVTLLVSTSRSMVTQVVSEQDYGKAFSIISCFDAIANMIGSVIILNVYRITVDFFTGFGYLFIAGLYILVFILLLYLHTTLAGNTGERVHLKGVEDDKEKYVPRNKTEFGTKPN